MLTGGPRDGGPATARDTPGSSQRPPRSQSSLRRARRRHPDEQAAPRPATRRHRKPTFDPFPIRRCRRARFGECGGGAGSHSCCLQRGVQPRRRGMALVLICPLRCPSTHFRPAVFVPLVTHKLLRLQAHIAISSTSDHPLTSANAPHPQIIVGTEALSGWLPSPGLPGIPIEHTAAIYGCGRLQQPFSPSPGTDTSERPGSRALELSIRANNGSIFFASAPAHGFQPLEVSGIRVDDVGSRPGWLQYRSAEPVPAPTCDGDRLLINAIVPWNGARRRRRGVPGPRGVPS